MVPCQTQLKHQEYHGVRLYSADHGCKKPRFLKSFKSFFLFFIWRPNTKVRSKSTWKHPIHILLKTNLQWAKDEEHHVKIEQEGLLTPTASAPPVKRETCILPLGQNFTGTGSSPAKMSIRFDSYWFAYIYGEIKISYYVRAKQTFFIYSSEQSNSYSLYVPTDHFRSADSLHLRP